jgi:hypothetical protein
VILHSDSPLQEKDAACELRFESGGVRTAGRAADRFWGIFGDFRTQAPVSLRIEARSCTNQERLLRVIV